MVDLSEFTKPSIKKYVHKPISLRGKWVVRIVDSPSPFANILEEIEFNTSTAAFHGYAEIKRTMGKWV